MCIIIDASIACLFFNNAKNKNFRPIHDWFRSKGRLVCGGKLTKELQKIDSAMAYLLELKRSGKLFNYAEDQLVPFYNQLRESQQMKSNDVHVLALAIASEARILCTEDNDLISDFTNRAVLGRSRGKVYKNKQYSPKILNKLLVHNSNCLGKHKKHGQTV